MKALGNKRVCSSVDASSPVPIFEGTNDSPFFGGVKGKPTGTPTI